MSYEVGNLDLTIKAVSTDALASLDAVIKKLNEVDAVLATVTKQRSIRTSDTKKHNKAWTESTYIVGRYGKQYLSTFSQITKGTKGYQNITETFNEQGKVIKTVTKTIDEYGNKVTKISGKENKVTKKGAFGLSNLGMIFAKIGVALHAAKRLGRYIAKIVDYGNDFTETLNMWQVAFKGSLDTADKFVSKMHRAYGISTETLMRNQAIYKNMLAQMGYMTEDTSTMLSESITQMVLDYSSLWNTTIESASEKFKAMLAGQIRPIRAISGISVEEKAIYDIYSSMGGTKTMRQLNQTEKRLLRIYATFSQMASSGAVGDFAKTIEQFANQSRLMTEYWKELVTWIGIGVKELLQASGIMQYINASLIFATEIVKALVMRAGYEDPNFLDGIFESAEEASDAVDELKGKLLGFDKFRALEDTSAGVDVNIDEKVLALLSQYQSVLDNVTNKSQALAESWLKSLGLVDENGDGVLDLNYALEGLISNIKTIATFLGVLAGYKTVIKVIALTKAIEGATLGIKLFGVASDAALFGGVFLIIYALNDSIANWDKMTSSMKAAKIAILAVGVALATFGVLSKIATASTTAFTTALTLQKIATVSLAVGGIGLLIANFTLLVGSWDKMKTWERVIGIFGAIGAAALAAAAAVAAFQGSWTMGTAAVAIVGALAAIAAAFVGFKASMRDIGEFAQGGLPDKGSLFIAGEAGAELVVNSPGGQSAVMNMQQLQSAITRGMVTALSTLGSGSTSENITIKIGEDEVFTVLRKSAKRRGLDFARV